MGGGQCRCCGSFPDPQLEHAETCGTAEATRGHYACFHTVVCGKKLADPGITTEPTGLTASQTRLIFSPPLLSPGRSAALDVGVASSIAAAARRGAAQAAFDRKLSHYRNEIVERQQGIQYRPCLDNGRPHPAVTERFSSQHCSVPQRSANVCKVPSAQMETRDPLWRRAAMARAVLLNPSARAEWLFAGIVGPCVAGVMFSSCRWTTTMPTQRLIEQHQTMPTTTSPLSPFARLSLSSRQVSYRWSPPIRCGLFLARDGSSG